MSLEIKINEAIKESMRIKNSTVLDSLRAIKAQILLAKTEKGAENELTEDIELKILQKLYKQRKESAFLFKEQNRIDLAEEEIAQAKVIEKYLPEKISKEDLVKIIKEIIVEMGAISIRDMGKVMGVATKKIAGRSDGKTISMVVRNLLK